jgi:dTDP-4-amino-4,6-dideoxygalactose transaminase
MLNGVIGRDRGKAAESILSHYRQRYHSHAVLVPCGRFGLYAAAKELLRPGDRVAISPITCRTVIDALVAAEVCPVFVDIELETGNIDVSKLHRGLLHTLRAIVTTNLYGNPDCVAELKRIAATHGLLLIEDCAHVLGTSIGGQQIGTIGDVSVFSFKKYFDEPGGVVTLRSEGAARRIQERVDSETSAPLEAEERARYLQHQVAKATFKPIAASLSAIYGCWKKSARIEPNGQESAKNAPTDGMRQREILPTTATLLRVAGLLSHVDRFKCARIAAASNLIALCPLELKKSSYSDHVCYLVVPFFSSKRDAVVAAMEKRGIQTYFRYTPPLTEVFRAGLDADYPLHRDVIDHWCRNILPVRLQFGVEYLETIQVLS